MDSDKVLTLIKIGAEPIRVSTGVFNGRKRVDIRHMYDNSTDTEMPKYEGFTKKGVSLPLEKALLDQLITALQDVRKDAFPE